MQTLLKSTQAYRLLKTEGARDNFSHAYLLLFNDAKNLRFALKTFAKLFFHCDEPKTEQERRISRLIEEDTFSDCLSFPADGKKLTVDDAERILEESTLQPVEGGRKLFLLADFAEANTQTQNKLLKLLEEPPKGVVFLLGATISYPVLTTVLSRTKQLEILPFSVDEITQVLKRAYPEKDKNELTMYAAAANGCVGEAENMLTGDYYQSVMEAAFSLALSTPSTLPALAKQVGETKRQKELLSALRLIFRDALLVKQFYKTDRKGTEKALLLAPQKEKLIQVSEKYSPAALLYAQEAFSVAEKQVRFNAVFAQCIELCFAKIQKI